MRRLWIIVLATLTALLIIPQALASLQVNYSAQINFAQFEHYSVDVFINNSNDYDIFNVTFSSTNITETYTPTNMSKNTTMITQLIFNSNQSMQKSVPITLSYSKIIEYTRQPTFNTTIKVQPNQFSPNDVTIVEGSQLTFINTDNITHTITGTEFDRDMPVGTNYTHQFNLVGTQIISEPFTGYSMILRVIPFHEFIYVHDSANDVVLNFNVNISRVESSLDAAMLQPTNKYFFITLATLQQEAVIRIMNNGNRTAENVQISAPWFTVDKSAFSLEPGRLTLIKLVTDVSFGADDFDKNIIKNILITSDNTQTQVINVTFYINSTGLKNGTQDDAAAGILAAIKALCKSNPHSPLCELNPPAEIVEKPVYYERNIGVNYTASDVYALNRNYQTLQEQYRQSQTAQNQKLDEYNQKVDKATSKVEGFDGKLSDIQDKLNTTTTVSLSQQKEASDYREIFLRVTLTAMITILCGTLLVIGIWWLDNKHRIEGHNT